MTLAPLQCFIFLRNTLSGTNISFFTICLPTLEYSVKTETLFIAINPLHQKELEGWKNDDICTLKVKTVGLVDEIQ